MRRAEAEAAIAARSIRLGVPLHLLAETGSTNDDAKAAAKEGAPHGAVWVAETQTHGRGRQGRAWISPAGENLLFSVLMRFPCVPARVPPLSLVVGLVVRDTVANALGDDAAVKVKWPNDVHVRGKKVAGILVESSLAGAKVENLVIGIGINVHTREFPTDLAAIATSVAREGGLANRTAILADVLAGLDRDIEQVAHRGLGFVHARLGKHDALLGRRVTGDGVEGVAVGIDLEGRLIVRNDDDSLQRVVSGEVRIRLQ